MWSNVLFRRTHYIFYLKILWSEQILAQVDFIVAEDGNNDDGFVDFELEVEEINWKSLNSLLLFSLYMNWKE